MYTAIVFLPLIGALITGLGGKRLSMRAAQVITSSLLVVAAILATYAFIGIVQHNMAAADGHGHVEPIKVTILSWFASGDFKLDWALRIDTLTAVMFIVVTYVSSVVHIYSIGYMEGDKGVRRFHTYLSLFTFAMLMLVSSDNLVQLFFGWEGVGVCSYLLIGYYYHKDSANQASMKAFIVNRVGDFGFALGIFATFMLVGSVDFDAIFHSAESLKDQELLGASAVTVICLLLFIGAMGKSAQLGLHTWLPDAMEGPTPVSALIHAATMVTAGVFLVCRMSPLFEMSPFASDVVTYVGAATALFAATVGMTQFDIKRVIAYSTCSQLGYMFFAAGVGAYGGAMFHLMTHAFFKALLFLGAGSVIHALHHEQDMRNMGGIWRKIPITYTYMVIGSLALAGVGIPGVFGFAGFYSKDAILESAYAAHSLAGNTAFWFGILAAFMTAFYSWRLLLLTFHGSYRGDKHTFDHAHESPAVMIVPLALLALGAIFAGFYAYEWFFGHDRFAFFAGAIAQDHHDIVDKAHHVPEWVKLAPLVVGLAGIASACVVYGFGNWGPTLAKIFTPLDILFRNKWFFDEIYDAIFVRPAIALGRVFWKTGDEKIIDGLGPNGIASRIAAGARQVARMQTGYIYHYAFAMLIGVVVFVTYYLLAVGF